MGSVEDNDDPDWIPEEEDEEIDEKEYQDLRPFIMLIERYRIPARQAAMLWNASLLCNGNKDKSKLLTHSKILRLQARYGKEIVEEWKAKQRPYLAVESDGKEAFEPFGHNKEAKHNFVTTVGLPVPTDEDPEPEVEFASHFKSRETGLAIANGVCELIDDSKSKDAVLVSKSDGSANNTSPDVGSHKVKKVTLHIFNNNYSMTSFSVTSFRANLGLVQLGVSSETSFSVLINLF